MKTILFSLLSATLFLNVAEAHSYRCIGRTGDEFKLKVTDEKVKFGKNDLDTDDAKTKKDASGTKYLLFKNVTYGGNKACKIQLNRSLADGIEADAWIRCEGEVDQAFYCVTKE